MISDLLLEFHAEEIEKNPITRPVRIKPSFYTLEKFGSWCLPLSHKA
jgi:hypothetical protein